MDEDYKGKLLDTVIRKYQEAVHTSEMQALSGQLEYLSPRDRAEHELKYRDDQIVLEALQHYKKVLERK